MIAAALAVLLAAVQTTPGGVVIVDPAEAPIDLSPAASEPDAGAAQATCLLPARPGMRVVALGAYEGATSLSLSFEGDSHDVGLITVGANRRGPPVLLVLSAYDPVVWDLAAVPPGRLSGVLVMGYHHQGVRGLPRGVPLRISTHKGRRGGCGDYAYAYQGGPDLERLDGRVRAITGRGIDAFQGAYGPHGFHIDGGAAPSARDLPQDGRGVRADAPVRRDAVAPKEAGIAQLLAAGALRPVTAADRAALSDALTRASSTGHLARVPSDVLDFHSYVVLRPVALPKGMYGAHSATFLLPRGMPWPVDPGSHNSYYRLDTGQCRGAMCPR